MWHRFRPRGGLFYGWWLVLVGAVINTIGGGGVGLPPMADPVFENISGDAARTGLARAIAHFATLLLFPFAGWAVDK